MKTTRSILSDFMKIFSINQIILWFLRDLAQAYMMSSKKINIKAYLKSFFFFKIDFLGFPIYLVQSFLKQTLESIGFMHSRGLTHTDLKVIFEPQNYLIGKKEQKSIIDYSSKL
jgi:serine/threonine protein kinase